ncbi:MAG TPA: hypothetical protein VFY40_19990 [Blastocatellia bacterium]|nr:hypothetical protein [Blastocatellia bacterium]
MNPTWKLGVLFLPPALTMLRPGSAKLNSVAQKTEPDYSGGWMFGVLLVSWLALSKI